MSGIHQFTYTPDAANPHDHVGASVHTNAESLPLVLEAMEAYLKAAGFQLGGHLDIVEDDEG